MSDEEVVVERDFTAEAVKQGWKEDGPLDAQAFVEKGEKIAGILKNKNTRLENRIESLEKSNRQFGEYHKQTLETQKRENADKVAALKDKLAQAVTDGDGQAYTRVSNEIETIQEAAPVQTDDAQAWNQLSQEWARDNQWYSTNPKLAAYADGLSERIQREGYTGKAYFSELTKRVMEDFSEEFENPNKSKPNSVESGGQISTTDSKAKTYANLPADAKAACDGFVTEGFMTREDYVKQFEFEQGGQGNG